MDFEGTGADILTRALLEIGREFQRTLRGYLERWLAVSAFCFCEHTCQSGYIPLEA